MAKMKKIRHIFSIILCMAIIGFWGCNDNSEEPVEISPYPECRKPPSERIDAHTPTVVVSDWGQPVRLESPINTSCPEDAIEISRDGTTLYFLFTTDILDSLSVDEILSRPNGTYRATKIGGPGDFDMPTYYDLGKGTDGSLDGELSFSPDGSQVYFHSLRSANTGYQANPPTDDFLDIYVADIINGTPSAGVNLGAPVNSVYPDGEHALHPDSQSLYFASHRPGGSGGADLWVSTKSGGVWSNPVNLGQPVNSYANDLQPAFTTDGDTIYFMSDRNPFVGAAIYRSNRNLGSWSTPELVISGIAGEPAITADGSLLYFVHVLTDANGVFDADIWYTARVN
jgi:hypothetical protein